VHNYRCDYGFISCAKVKYLSDIQRGKFSDIYVVILWIGICGENKTIAVGKLIVIDN